MLSKMAKSDVVYVNFDESDFLDVRKNILSSTINSISLLKKCKEFKALRKEENKIKRELAVELRSCYAEINHFIESIPKSGGVVEDLETPIKRTTVKRKVKRATAKKKGLDADLENIKERLASLG